jgi:NitT/TauT family transport system ATP-binding protein
MKLRVWGVSKSFFARGKELLALQDINLAVEQGEFLCLVGPSGCGKSTLLSIIAGLLPADRGHVYTDDKLVSGPSTDRLVMFQDGALFPWLNVRANVEFGLHMTGMAAAQRRELSDRFLRMVHLGSFGDANVHELSGGMKQRVALARALALNPDVLLMDEPFGALDAQTRDILHRELQDIWARTQKTILFVTHDVEEAIFLSDRVFVMTARPGKIKAEIDIPLERPRSYELKSTEAFLGLKKQALTLIREEAIKATLGRV